MLPFAVVASFVRTKSRDLSEFTSPVNKLTTVPIFLGMGSLILLIEIFSISISGFLFFICMLVLFVQRKIDYNNIMSWLIVITLQVLCLSFIVANFIATTSLVSATDTNSVLEFYGIDALNDFLNYPTSRGYFICLCLLFIVSCFVQRIFAYQNMWKIASQLLVPQTPKDKKA